MDGMETGSMIIRYELLLEDAWTYCFISVFLMLPVVHLDGMFFLCAWLCVCVLILFVVQALIF